MEKTHNPSFPTTIIFSLLTFFLLFHSSTALLRQYDLTDHPFNTLSTFSGFSPTSVIMKRYYQFNGGSKRIDTRHLHFIPRSATYDHVNGGRFFTDLDVLSAPNANPNARIHGTFTRFELNHPARVFVVLAGRGTNRAFLKSLAQSISSSAVTVTGLPSGWDATPIPLVFSGNDRQIVTGNKFPRGETNDRHFRNAVAFEITTMPDNLLFNMPEPFTISVNGITFSRARYVFAKTDTSKITPFDEPALPPSFNSHVKKDVYVNPASAVPRPNEYCPEWVHDLYVVRTRSKDDELGNEPLYWRTWHPLVDPVYWCHFDHEHGAYPGIVGYRPMFGYTAWKTRDSSDSDVRQNESHNGFKILSFEVPDGRAVVFTVHMHLSLPRRFTTRHHTLILAILSKEGELQAELHMKMDFGAALVTLNDGKFIPVDEVQAEIQDDVNKKNNFAMRRFNLINIDDGYPETVDKTYRVKIENDPNRMRGIYELWRSLFPTCVSASHGGSFRFDIQDPSSSIRFPGDYECMSWLAGYSMQRVLFIREFTVSKKQCSFDIPSGKEVFYTDSYFSSLHDGPGDFKCRQFLSSKFTDLKMPTGHITSTDFWSGYYKYGSSHKMLGINIAKAVDRKQN